MVLTSPAVHALKIACRQNRSLLVVPAVCTSVAPAKVTWLHVDVFLLASRHLPRPMRQALGRTRPSNLCYESCQYK
jgi:hypothetical protein